MIPLGECQSYALEDVSNDGRPYAVQLLEKLRGIQAGKLEDKWGWRLQIPAPPADF